MIFNSFIFLLFFTSFFLLYWNVFNKSIKQQNLFLLVCSYVFYAYADWRFLLLLIAVSAFNYFLALGISKSRSEATTKLYIYAGLLQGVGLLAFFKYFNFFIDSFNEIFQLIGINFSMHTLNLIIPLGISFFTFKTISYILDVDKGKIEPTKDWVVFFNYIAFFPTLLSGPIDKGRTFIPQLEKKRKFDYSRSMDGLRQITWGMLKEVVIADNL